MNPEICPECGAEESRVIDSRLTKEYRRRRYQCAKVECKHRWNTHEQMVLDTTTTTTTDRAAKIRRCMDRMALIHEELSELLST